MSRKKKGRQEYKQAGAELGQAQPELGCGENDLSLRGWLHLGMRLNGQGAKIGLNGPMTNRV